MFQFFLLRMPGRPPNGSASQRHSICFIAVALTSSEDEAVCCDMAAIFLNCVQGTCFGFIDFPDILNYLVKVYGKVGYPHIYPFKYLQPYFFKADSGNLQYSPPVLPQKRWY